MTHALPDDSSPDPQPSVSVRPELFTLAFWLVVIARVVRGVAVGGTAVLGSHYDNLGAVPWQGMAAGCVVGAIMSLSASLANMFIPDNTASSVAARFTIGRK